MSGQKIAYRRVSSVDQSLDRQLVSGEFDMEFEEKISAASPDRKVLKDCINYCRTGDTLFVHSIDRLARDLRQLQEIVETMVAKGVTVHFVEDRLVFSGESDPMSTLTLQLMGAFAQFERTMIKKRQAEGIARAKAQGKYKGRKPLSKSTVIGIVDLYLQGRKKVDIASIMDVSLTSVYKEIGKYEKKQELIKLTGGEQ